MQLLRPIAVLASIAVHAAIAFAFLTSEPATSAFDQGSGVDAFSTDLKVTIEGSSMLGGTEEIVETADITPVQQVTKADPVETKEPEVTDVVTSTEATTEAPQEIKDAKPTKEEKTAEVTTQEVPAMDYVEQQNAARKLSGGDVAAQRIYMGEIAKRLQRYKVNPRSTQEGTVLVRFTVDAQGGIMSRTILQSSGSKLLDDAAMASLDRAAPFPPLPGDIAHGPLELQVPFHFVTR